MKPRMYTLPNILTLCNLLCGSLALVLCLWSRDTGPFIVFWLVIAAAVFDFLDGFAARLTGAYSEIGKQLDSLADVVSFGAIPSALLFTMYVYSGGGELGIYYGIITAAVVLFSALRLAKFNIDEEQKTGFTGLPTPACALFVASSYYLVCTGTITVHPFTVLAVSLVLAYLLVSPVRMFALKFTDWSWRQNKVRYLFVLLSGVAMALWHIAAIPFVIAGYVAVSVLVSALCRGGRGA
ncbi:MAG: CDP-diacylglycerol--serine O-phosphatidyltransferase [Alistipes sp.]|nr:CDP-diacylglycerol--serine O-phosphatidyltransferase [Alistipes sp.]